MKIKSQIIKIFLFTTALFFAGCETIDLNQTENPSGVNENLSDPVYAFNYIQIQLADFVDSANSFTQRVTRQMAMTGGNTYENAFAPVNFNDNWNTGYRLLNAIKLMEPKALQNKEYLAYGSAKVIKAYVMITLVDLYGDVPYSEALQGSGNLTPKFDKGEDVYKQALVVLDEAIELINNTNTKTPTDVQDLFYSNSKLKWTKLANTLKFKIYMSARLASGEIGLTDAELKQKIKDILDSGNYISDSSDDFAFNYGNSRFNPNARHPLYNDQYELGGGAYIANYFMWAMSTEKNLGMDAKGTVPYTYESNPPTGPLDSKFVNDPRANFYFFKQDADPAGEDTFTLPNRSRPAHYDDSRYNSFYFDAVRAPYTVSNWISGSSVPTNGYWGRDHGDNSGIPPDAQKRTVAGVYPIGGAYGSPTDVQTSGDKGALGAGIMPIIMSSYIHFLKAEAIMTLGISGDVKSELLLGVEQSIDRVLKPIGTYPEINKDDRPYPWADEARYAPGTLITNQNTGATNGTWTDNYSSWGKIYLRDKSNYLKYISSKYDELSVSDRLELIIKEYYLASWGNGIEPYNNYRRTGFPSNMQPTLEVDPGEFYYRALYPGESVNNNPNAPANVRTKRVFWDKAGIELH